MCLLCVIDWLLSSGCWWLCDVECLMVVCLCVVLGYVIVLRCLLVVGCWVMVVVVVCRF